MRTISEFVPRKTACRLPAEPGMWVFIAGDLLMFGTFFLSFLHYRGVEPELYKAGALALNEILGLINTLALLTSSWLVALALHALRRGRHRSAFTMTASGALLGLMFVTIKILEYSAKIDAGITVATNDFFMFYFMFTGIHLLHVIAGVGMLGYMMVVLRKEPRSANLIPTCEVTAIFWHLVDLLWVILFPLIYLLR